MVNTVTSNSKKSWVKCVSIFDISCYMNFGKEVL